MMLKNPKPSSSSGSFQPAGPPQKKGAIMKTNNNKMVSFKLDVNNLPPLTEKQKKEVEALAAMPDEQIDLSDMPELTDDQLKNAVRLRFYKPVKQQITARLDSDVLHWLKSQGRGNQSRINSILREKMIESMKR
jgi:uncharacterized protein (DUF4415 family)